MEDSWAPDRTGDGPVAIRGWYEQSERVFGQLLGPAGIPAERTRAAWPHILRALGLSSEQRPAGRPRHQ